MQYEIKLAIESGNQPFDLQLVSNHLRWRGGTE